MSALEEAIKTCTRCNETKNLSDFHRNARNSDGRHSWCAECLRAYARERTAKLRDEDPDGMREHQRYRTRKSRKKTGGERDRKQRKAWERASRQLRDAHEKEWERLYRQARIDEGLGP